MQNVQVLFGKLNARFSSSFCIIEIYFEQNISMLKYEKYKIIAKSTSIKICLVYMAFPSLSIHAAGQKKSHLTNVLLLFMTETGRGK